MYSSRNGNNPGTLDMALSVGPSALYSLRFGPARLPLLLKAYAHTDLLGLAFSQEFGETLYELYYFGQPSRRIYLTHPLKAPTGFVLTSVDVPVLDYFTLSVGYRWDYRRTELNHLSAYRHQHSLLIGVTTKILPLEGRRAADDHSTLCPSDMKHLTKLLAVLGLLLSLACCTTEREYTADPYANYDRLWEILDRGYCYFDLKLPHGTTWRDLYHKHRRDLRPTMTTDSLFLVMSQLLAELRDGHVNLISTFDYGRYWQWRSEGPRSYDETLIESYLGDDYHIAGGLAYKSLDYPKGVRRAEPIGYIRVASFSSAISSSNVNAVLNRLKACNGLILDLRNNGGWSSHDLRYAGAALHP